MYTIQENKPHSESRRSVHKHAAISTHGSYMGMKVLGNRARHIAAQTDIATATALHIRDDELLCVPHADQRAGHMMPPLPSPCPLYYSCGLQRHHEQKTEPNSIAQLTHGCSAPILFVVAVDGTLSSALVLKQGQQSSLAASCLRASYTTNAVNIVDWARKPPQKARAQNVEKRG